jgi:hypothetical protein
MGKRRTSKYKKKQLQGGGPSVTAAQSPPSNSKILKKEKRILNQRTWFILLLLAVSLPAAFWAFIQIRSNNSRCRIIGSADPHPIGVFDEGAYFVVWGGTLSNDGKKTFIIDHVEGRITLSNGDTIRARPTYIPDSFNIRNNKIGDLKLRDVKKFDLLRVSSIPAETAIRGNYLFVFERKSEPFGETPKLKISIIDAEQESWKETFELPPYGDYNPWRCLKGDPFKISYIEGN